MITTYTIKRIFKLPLSITARQTYIVTLANLVFALTAFLFTVFCVRYLNIGQLGYFSALLSMILVLSDVADLGIGGSLSHFLPRLNGKPKLEKKFIKTAFYFQLSFGLILSAVIILSAPVISRVFFQNRDIIGLVRISALGIIASLVVNFCQYVLSARMQFIYSSFITITSGFGRLILFGVLIILGIQTLENTVYIQIATLILMAFLGMRFLKVEWLPIVIQIKNLKKLLSFSSYLGFTKIINSFQLRIDILLLILLSTPEQTGIYTIAQRIIMIYSLIGASLSTVLSPKISSIIDPIILKKFFGKLSIALVGITISLILIYIEAELVIDLLFGEKALPAVFILRPLLIGVFFTEMGLSLGLLLIYYFKRPDIVAMGSIMQLTAFIIANMRFISFYGGKGTAYSFIFSNSLYFIFLLIATIFCYKRSLSNI